MIQARNVTKPLERQGQNSIFRFVIGAQHYRLENFSNGMKGIAGCYLFQQRYVIQNVKGGVKSGPGLRCVTSARFAWALTAPLLPTGQIARECPCGDLSGQAGPGRRDVRTLVRAGQSTRATQALIACLQEHA